MKPLHVGVLLVAGAIGGAVIMKVAFQPQTVAPAAVVAQVQAPPATAPATPPAEPAEDAGGRGTEAAPPGTAPAVAAGVPGGWASQGRAVQAVSGGAGESGTRGAEAVT